MAEIPNIFRRFIPQLLHVIVLPVFFFVFILVYRPLDAQNLLGTTHFGVHITLLSCIILLSITLIRLLYYFLPLKINYTLYVFWCLLEIVFVSFFVALYIWLALFPATPYYEVLTDSFELVSLTLVIPYSILGVSLRVWQYHEREIYASEPSAQKRMRFYDEKHNLKLVLTPQSILFISAEENYVNIHYTENDKVRNYVLRSSMRAIEESCLENGLVRCHRSFFINPSHVKVLRKDQEGVVYAELDAPDLRHIPVSKRYYENLSNLL